MTDDEAQQVAPAEAGKKQKPKDPIAEKDKEIEELTDTLKRVQAEFENFKKRTDKDIADRIKMANQRLVLELLPILDSLDQAVQDSENGRPEDRRGLEGLRKQFLQVLQREGLKEIRADGMLDPFAHEVLLVEEGDDADDGKILQVFQKGYSFNSRPIRPARVKVARRKMPERPEEERQQEPSHDHDNQLNKNGEEGQKHEKGKQE